MEVIMMGCELMMSKMGRDYLSLNKMKEKKNITEFSKMIKNTELDLIDFKMEIFMKDILTKIKFILEENMFELTNKFMKDNLNMK